MCSTIPPSRLWGWWHIIESNVVGLERVVVLVFPPAAEWASNHPKSSLLGLRASPKFHPATWIRRFEPFWWPGFPRAVGSLRERLGAIRRLWELLRAFGSLWVPSGASGSLQESLGAFGSLWDPLGSLREPLGAFGSFWEPSGISLCSV